MKLDDFKISVIIPTYNDGQYLKQAIESVLSQTLKPSEIIVVDDGSINNESEGIVKSFEASDNKITIHYFYQENSGPSSARNRGVKEARGNYIAFLDADDKWLDDNLSHKASFLYKTDNPSDYFGIYGSFVFSDTGLIQKFCRADGNSGYAEKIGRRNGIPGGLPSFLLLKKAYEDVGGLDPNLTINEDFDLILRLLKKGYLVKGDSEAGFIRNIREGSLTRSDNYIEIFNKTTLFLNKALTEKLLSEKEIRRRRRDLSFSTAKKLFKQNYLNFSFIHYFLIGIKHIIRKGLK